MAFPEMPIEPIAELFNIPEKYYWILIFCVFLIGYLIMKYAIKKKQFENIELDGIDKAALITGFGLIWFLRILIIGRWIYVYSISIINNESETGIIAVFPMAIALFAIAVIMFDLFSLKYPERKYLDFMKTRPGKDKTPIWMTVYGIGLCWGICICIGYFLQGIGLYEILLIILIIIMFYMPWSYLLIKGFKKIA